MKYIFSFVSLVLSAIFCFSQKPPVDNAAFDGWPSVEATGITNDGNYFIYTTHTGNVWSFRNTLNAFVIQGIHTDWKMDIPDATEVHCTTDSRIALFARHDSLGIILLGGSLIGYIPNVGSFKIPTKSPEEWLAYQTDTGVKDVIVRNLKTDSRVSFGHVVNYMYSPDETILLVQSRINVGNQVTDSLIVLNLNDGKKSMIWGGAPVNNIVFAAGDGELAFATEQKVDSTVEKTFWCYTFGADKPTVLVNHQFAVIDPGLEPDNIQNFSLDGRRLFINLKKKDTLWPIKSAVPVDVWSYKDTKLLSEQINELHQSHGYLAVITIGDGRIVQLQRENENVYQSNGDFALVEPGRRNVDVSEKGWNPAWGHTLYLVAYSTGTRERAKRKSDFFDFSPDGKYVISYDPEQKSYFSYVIASGDFVNICSGSNTNWTIYGNDRPNSSYAVDGVIGWLKGDVGALIHDQNDIWLADPTGKRKAVNLTHGYGRQHEMVFRLASDLDPIHFAYGDTILLSAFDRNTKENGFYRIVIHQQGGRRDPELLTMGPYIYDIPLHPGRLNGVYPVKAANALVYFFRRESATESPNYFSTSDFKAIRRLTDVHPERNYNWLSAELISLKTFDGSFNQGILYKPEDFDPKKKYPVIFNYYEIKSDGLNGYIQPEPSYGDLNITWFVSNGYLVFIPDIHFKNGETGPCALHDILSAAEYLAGLPYVNSKKMGIQGHSFGGYETNYLVTHTHLFAAACSASGPSDFVSGYGSLFGSGVSQQGQFEQGQSRIGPTLWQRPDLYLRNSPVFQADQMATPLLMMATTIDGSVPFTQAVEFFTALRRLGKKVWLLQYEDCEHGVLGASGVDFTIRMQQFFDHYLKGATPPKWLTEVVPANKKGMETGLELDRSGKEP